MAAKYVTVKLTGDNLDYQMPKTLTVGDTYTLTLTSDPCPGETEVKKFVYAFEVLAID